MNAYTMRRFTIIAPHVTNSGEPSGNPEALAAGLLAAGIDGWTEYQTVGCWRGHREPGTCFEIYRDDARSPWARADFAARLARIGRAAMPDQEAIQITADIGQTTLWEG